MEKVITFLKDVRLELSKVSWPTRDQTAKYTVVVISLSLVIALFLGGMDFLFQWVLNKFVLK